MATVVVPYVDGMLNPGTRAAVCGSGLPYRLVELDRADPAGYARLVIGLWRQGDTFIICEQDVVPTFDQLWDISICGHPWCSYEYDDHLYPPGAHFGLAGFDGTVMAAFPDAARSALMVTDAPRRYASRCHQVGRRTAAGDGRWAPQLADWWHVDALMIRHLTIRRVAWAQHPGQVRHAHVGPVSGPDR